MDISYCLILFVLVGGLCNESFAHSKEKFPDELSRNSRFHKMNVTATKSRRGINLTFPGCGLRSPKIQGKRRRGLFSRLDKKSSEEGFLYSTSANSTKRGRPMIIGGVPAKPHSWPWMVALCHKDKGIICGSSLISRKYILTAAHCFDDVRGSIKLSNYYILVGAQNIDKDGSRYYLKKILLHPDYEQNKDDIAILEIEKKVKLSKKVYPVCLPSDALKGKMQSDIKSATVTGWGFTKNGGPHSKILQELTIHMVPLKKCEVAYYATTFTKKHICASAKVEGKGSCQGDSGGPLVSKMKDNSYVQIGLVSGGNRLCAHPDLPEIYTKISEYTKWISDNTDLGKA